MLRYIVMIYDLPTSWFQIGSYETKWEGVIEKCLGMGRSLRRHPCWFFSAIFTLLAQALFHGRQLQAFITHLDWTVGVTGIDQHKRWRPAKGRREVIIPWVRMRGGAVTFLKLRIGGKKGFSAALWRNNGFCFYSGRIVHGSTATLRKTKLGSLEG